MNVPRLSKTYPAPQKWDDVVHVKQQMQIDLLKHAQVGATSLAYAARKIGMTSTLYGAACRRLGVPVDHLPKRTTLQPAPSTNACVRQGWEAYEHGLPDSACPHTQDALRAAWHRGWQAAHQWRKEEIISKMGD